MDWFEVTENVVLKSCPLTKISWPYERLRLHQVLTDTKAPSLSYKASDTGGTSRKRIFWFYRVYVLRRMRESSEEKLFQMRSEQGSLQLRRPVPLFCP